MDEVWQAFARAMGEAHYFEAHEILEVPWRQTHDRRLQMTIWIAAAFVHWARDHGAGSKILLERLKTDSTRPPHDVLLLVDAWLREIHRGASAVPPSPHDLATLAAWVLGS